MWVPRLTRQPNLRLFAVFLLSLDSVLVDFEPEQADRKMASAIKTLSIISALLRNFISIPLCDIYAANWLCNPAYPLSMLVISGI